MNFGFSEEQDLLRQGVRKLLDERCPLDEVRRLVETPDGYSRELWKELGELGFLGLGLPESFGGAGLGPVDLVVLLEETGRSLFPSPLVSTTLAGSVILDAGDAAQRGRWLPDLAAGTRIGTLAFFDVPDLQGLGGIRSSADRDGDGFVLSGEKTYVVDAQRADLLVLAFRVGEGEGDVALAVVEADAPGVTVSGLRTMDATKSLGRVRLDGVRVSADAVLPAPEGAALAIERALDRGAMVVTAEMIGAAEGALALTVEFAKQRVQFGSPIGRFQGVKHPLAEGYVAIESLKSLLYYAAWAIDRSPAEIPRAVSEAKAFGSLAFSKIGIDGVQLHGAIGFTLECDIQLYLRRAKWSRPMFGDEDFHHDRIAALGGW